MFEVFARVCLDCLRVNESDANRVRAYVEQTFIRRQI
jgi:hypothetical protein